MRATHAGVARTFIGILIAVVIVTIGLVGSSGQPGRVPSQLSDLTLESGVNSACADPGVSRAPAVIVSDTLESGSLRRWRIVEDGDAVAGVSAAAPFRGRLSGRLRATSSRTSRANVQANVGARADEVWASSWFRVDREGTRESNVPTFRFFSGSSRVADVFRQNVTGQLFLRTARLDGGWRYVKLGRRMPLATWHHVQVHIRAAGDRSEIAVTVNGTPAYTSATVILPTSRLSTVMIGSEHVRQVMDMSFDDVVVRATTTAGVVRPQASAGWLRCAVAAHPADRVGDP